MTDETLPAPTPAPAPEAAQQDPIPVVIVEQPSTVEPAVTEPDPDAPRRITVSANTLAFLDIVDLEPEAMIKRIKGEDGKGPALMEETVAGLLEVERSGKNRTETVKALCEHLGVKSPYDVTAAGPAYTNDTTAVSKL